MASTLSLPTVGLVMPLASQRGGAESLFQHLLRTQSRSFRYTCLFLQEGPLVDEARTLGYETAVLATTHLSDVRNYSRTVLGIRRWMQASRLDLVFSWMQKAHLYAGPAAVSLRIKRMWFQHGISRRHWMDVLGAWVPADGILCCSGHVQETQDRQVPGRRSFVCHPGVPIPSHDIASKEAARAHLGLAADAQVICMVARLERWKGAHVFVEAARVLVRQFPTASFFIVGGAHPLDEAYADEIRAQAESSDLYGRFHLVGQRPSCEIPLWLASADIIVHPVTGAEPFGMVIVEALAAGRAVVASRAGGISEIIEDGVSGIFVPPGDANAVADVVRRLLGDPEGRERIESAARLRAQTFSIEAFARRFESLVSSVMAA